MRIVRSLRPWRWVRSEGADDLVVLVHPAPAFEFGREIKVNKADILRAFETEAGQPFRNFRMSADDDIGLVLMHPVREGALPVRAEIEDRNSAFQVLERPARVESCREPVIDVCLDPGVDHKPRPTVVEVLELPGCVHGSGKLVIAGEVEGRTLRANSHHHAGEVLPHNVKLGRQLPLVHHRSDDDPPDISCQEDLSEPFGTDSRLIEPKLVGAISEFGAVVAQPARPAPERIVFLQAVPEWRSVQDSNRRLVFRIPARSKLGHQVRNDRIRPVSHPMRNVLNSLPGLKPQPGIVPQGQRDGGFSHARLPGDG